MARDNANAAPAARTSSRCAIYTRKSTEEGLDQEFNSLDAQREACSAYILSQRHEGWSEILERYDDGGYSGGNMDRPSLVQLLADVKAGKVDVIIVYKVDRLTRSLPDFAKIVEVLDEAGASFVSITQAFNTTTSMGRLTLNVLLSFAQFEREVISERVRDKIAASKRKGMWMGGPVPLGYDVKERKLVVNAAEAETVRHIMRCYLELGSVPELGERLAREGIRSKVQRWSNGRMRGGQPFARGALYHLLSNRLYRGEIVHRGTAYPGEHQASVPDELWAAVQARLAENGVDRRSGVNASDPSLLAGMIRDSRGRRMVPSHARKGSLRYRYYVSVDETKTARALRVAASDVEAVILASLRSLLHDKPALLERCERFIPDAHSATTMIDQASRLADALCGTSRSEVRQLCMDLGLQLVMGDEEVSASVDAVCLARRLGLNTVEGAGLATRITLPIGPAIIRRGHEVRLVVGNDGDVPALRDGRLIELLIKARQARHQLLDLTGDQQQSTTEYSMKHLARMARLSFLAPDIVAAILDGTQPAALTARRLLRAAELPHDWHEQRRMFGFN
jgi:DNA invertase Pin-like site-specific DNA recombinase